MDELEGKKEFFQRETKQTKQLSALLKILRRELIQKWASLLSPFLA